MSRKSKLIIIVGPTASGKSELAVKIARKINGEIISADSRQVYRGLDIGTGKIPGKWTTKKDACFPRSRKKCIFFMYKNVPHHCIDFVSPKKVFTVTEFQKCALKAIRDILTRKKTPTITGGTGFWIDAVIYKTKFPNVPPNFKLRKRLSKKSPEEIFKILLKLDPLRAKTIEKQNPHRLIRAVEIAKAMGKVPKLKKTAAFRTLWLGVKIPKNTLEKKIRDRLDKRIREGMIQEARNLRKNGLSSKRFYTLGLEYRFLADYLCKKLTKEEMVRRLGKAIKDYAGRQMVWFKRNKKIIWVKNEREALKNIRNFMDGVSKPIPGSFPKKI